MSVQTDCEAAVRKVLNLPATGLAKYAGQPHNGNLAVHLIQLGQGTANSLDAVQWAIDSVKADTMVLGDDEADVLAALAAAEARLTALH